MRFKWELANIIAFKQNIVMVIMYGITNCSTVKKARNKLESNKIDYEFWDYKKQRIDESHLVRWCDCLGWQKVLNRSGTMWRKASDESKNNVVDQTSAIEFMLSVPTSIKRPILEVGEKLLLGFDEGEYGEVV